MELVFTKFAAASFLTLLQTCKELPERSNSYVGSLREALKDSIISAAADKHKNKTCYEFWSAILSRFNSAVLQHLKVFKSWYSTFQHRCDAVSAFAEYKNDFETDLQALEKHKAPGLKDQALLRAVILRGISCQQLDDTLHELQLNTKLSAADILLRLENKCSAITAREQLLDSTGSTAQSRRGSTARSSSSTGNSSGHQDRAKNKPWKIPAFPENLKDFMAPDAFKSLQVWRQQANRCKYGNHDKARLDAFKIRANPKSQWNPNKVPSPPPDGFPSEHIDDHASYDNRGRGSSKNHFRHRDSYGSHASRGRNSRRARASHSRSASRSGSRSRSPSRDFSTSSRSSRRSIAFAPDGTPRSDSSSASKRRKSRY